MKIGTICYATQQGLGILAKSFYDVGVVTDVVTVAHGSREDHSNKWYPGSLQVTNLHDRRQIEMMERFCMEVDVMLFFETPFRWPLIDWCRSVGTKTVVMPMYECMPKVWPATPDAILNPSLLDQRYYPSGTYIPVPVDKSSWRRRTKAEVFVHNAGHGGLRGRNGTRELIEAWRHVKSDARLILRGQEEWVANLDPRIEKRIGTLSSRDQLYAEGDVFVFPEKFNGLSLPLQEAVASGMCVMTTARFPNTEYLPPFVGIPVSHYEKACVSPRCVVYDEAVVTPRDIARTIDSVYGTDVQQYSVNGLKWAEDRSWDELLPLYQEFFNGVVG